MSGGGGLTASQRVTVATASKAAMGAGESGASATTFTSAVSSLLGGAAEPGQVHGVRDELFAAASACMVHDKDKRILDLLHSHIVEVYSALLQVAPQGAGSVGLKSVRSRVTFSPGAGASPGVPSPAPPSEGRSPVALGRSPVASGRRVTEEGTPSPAGGMTRTESFRAMGRSSSRLAIDKIKDKYLDKYKGRAGRHRRIHSSAGVRGSSLLRDDSFSASWATAGFAPGSASIGEDEPLAASLPMMKSGVGAGGVTTGGFAAAAAEAVAAAKAGVVPAGLGASPSHADVLEAARGSLDRSAPRGRSRSRGGGDIRRGVSLSGLREGGTRALQRDPEALNISPGREDSVGGLVDGAVSETGGDSDSQRSGSRSSRGPRASAPPSGGGSWVAAPPGGGEDDAASTSSASTPSLEGGEEEDVETAVRKRAQSFSARASRPKRESLKLPEQEGGEGLLLASADLLRRSSLSFRAKKGEEAPPAQAFPVESGGGGGAEGGS